MPQPFHHPVPFGAVPGSASFPALPAGGPAPFRQVLQAVSAPVERTLAFLQRGTKGIEPAFEIPQLLAPAAAAAFQAVRSPLEPILTRFASIRQFLGESMDGPSDPLVQGRSPLIPAAIDPGIQPPPKFLPEPAVAGPKLVKSIPL